MEANTYCEHADKRNYGPILAVQKVTKCAVCEAGCSGHEEPLSAVGSASQIDVQVPPEATWTRAATAGKNWQKQLPLQNSAHFFTNVACAWQGVGSTMKAIQPWYTSGTIRSECLLMSPPICMLHA